MIIVRKYEKNHVSCNIMKKDALSLYPLYLFSFGKDKKVLIVNHINGQVKYYHYLCS